MSSEPPPGPIVEFLTFHVPLTERDEWLRVEEQHWSRFLEQQPGFLRKQMWATADDPSSVHAVIWWASLEQWKAVPAEGLAAVERAMGPHERSGTCATFQVIRDC